MGRNGKLLCKDGHREEKDDITLEENNYNWTDHRGQEVKGRFSIGPGGHLEITGARDEDSGVYTCHKVGALPVKKHLTGKCTCILFNSFITHVLIP